MNTKPHGGETLVAMLLSIIGFKFYPPTTSTHYTLLDLHKYDIIVHRGSFLLPNKGKSPTSPLQQINVQSLTDQL